MVETRRDWDELLRPWTSEPPLVTERTHTVWADPRWQAWNEHAVEFQIALFLQHLAQHISRRGNIIAIETGVGQGFVTRRLEAAIDSHTDILWLFESDHEWRAQLAEHPWFDSRFGVCLKDDPTPTWMQMGAADLVVLDSNDPWRIAEVALWYACGKEDSVMFVHDTGNGHPSWDGHYSLGQLIRTMKIPGIWLENPRGAFLSQRNRSVPDQDISRLWTVVLEQTMSRA